MFSSVTRGHASLKSVKAFTKSEKICHFPEGWSYIMRAGERAACTAIEYVCCHSPLPSKRIFNVYVKSRIPLGSLFSNFFVYFGRTLSTTRRKHVEHSGGHAQVAKYFYATHLTSSRTQNYSTQFSLPIFLVNSCALMRDLRFIISRAQNTPNQLRRET